VITNISDQFIVKTVFVINFETNDNFQKLF